MRRLSRLVLLLAALAAAGLGACGSDEAGTDNGNEQQNVERDPAGSGSGPEAFCDAAAKAAEADQDGDPLGVANALQTAVDDVPEEFAEDLQAYIDTLEAASNNTEAGGDPVENGSAEASYRAYVDETCGSAEGATEGSGDGY